MTTRAVGGLSKADKRMAVAFVLVLGAVAVWRWMASGAPTGGDGAQYLAHALALVEGRPYGDIGYLYTPAMWTVGPLRYPPGLPVTLAPVLAVFGPFSQAPLVLMHLFLLAFVTLAGTYFARESGPRTGWGVAGMVAAAMLLGDHANVVGSDLGFCALVWGGLVLADRPGGWSPRRSGLITLLGCGALAYRLAAAPLVPAAAALAVLRRRQVGWAALVIALVWLGVLLCVYSQFGLEEESSALGGPGFGPAGSGPAGSGSGGPASGFLAGAQRWVQSVDSRLATYQDGLSQAYLYPLPARTANLIYHVGALGLTMVGLWGWLRRRRATLGSLFGAMTGLMLAVSPVWQPRYLWVLTPFLCYGFLLGVPTSIAWVMARVRKRHVPTHGSLPLRLGIVISCFAIVTAIIQPRPTYPPESEAWRGVKSALAELETGAPIRVASNRPRKVAWFTGVPAMPIVWYDIDLFLSEAERRDVTLVVFTTAVIEQDQLERWARWLTTYPDLFVLLAAVGPVRIFELTRYTAN